MTLIGSSETAQVAISTQECALCSLPLSSYPIVDEGASFCCSGCHAVFNILMAKGQLGGFKDHPVFLQAVKSGLISNPQLIEQIQRQRAEIVDGDREKLYLEVADMWCPSCAEIIRLLLLSEKGVLNCAVDYSTDLASVEFSPRYLSKDDIFNLISRLGYTPSPMNSTARKAVGFDLYLRFVIAAFCSLNIMMLAYPLYATYFSYDGENYGVLFAWIAWGFSLPVIFYCAFPIWRRFFTSLKVGLFGMETLIAMSVFSAFSLSFYELVKGGTHVYFDSMSVIITLVLLGKIIEARAKFSAKESLLHLSRSIPRRGRKRYPDGSLQFALVKDIFPDDVLVAFAGEKISMDGVVLEGDGACDESLMTGEAMPVSKQTGSKVLAGAILIQGPVAYKVTRSHDESALAKIIDMVEQDIGHKSQYVRAGDLIVKWFVPFVIIIAAGTASLCLIFNIQDEGKAVSETALLRALSILLISCPCAIGIAAPTAESHLLNGLASLGAIVRNRGCLRQLGKELFFVFDKTGTATIGHFKLLSGLEGLSKIDLSALYSLASQSTHPVSQAIASAVAGNFAANHFSDFDEQEKLPFDRIEEVVGQGIKGTLNGVFYCLGSEAHLRSQGIQLPSEWTTSDSSFEVVTKSYFAKARECLAQLTLGDTVRPELQLVLALLKPSSTLLLSGDAELPVKAVAKSCQFDRWHSGCNPLQKREQIEILRKKGHTVCMIGDGINDAPALTAANIGISVVSATDISIQVSDILLTTDQMTVIPKILALAKKGDRIVWQNMFFAFFFNLIGILLAIFGILSPVFAAVAMSISSLAVLFNARRI